MSFFRVGERVRISATWSKFVGRQGEVTHTDPIMVRLDGELFPIRFGGGELKSADDAPVDVLNPTKGR